MARLENTFEPDYAVPPGSVSSEILESRGISQAELARRCGRSPKLISEVLSGTAPIEPETAIQLERVLGMSATVWLNLESNYRLAIAQNVEKRKLERLKRTPSASTINTLVKLGFIRKPRTKLEVLREWLSFSGCGTPEVWTTNWDRLVGLLLESPARGSAPDAIAAWLRIGEIVAEKQELPAYSREGFLVGLREIRNLAVHSPKSDVLSSVKDACNRAGVAFVLLPSVPRARLIGSARWFNNKPIICQTLTHEYEDFFWFTFFHEAAHILLHGKRSVFLDVPTESKVGTSEQQADRFAESLLLSTKALERFCRAQITRDKILSFASEQKVSPGVIVGRLQCRRIIRRNEFNELRRRIDVAESAAPSVDTL